MTVKLIRAYACAPEGHTVITYPAESIVYGMVAKLALADGAGIEIGSMDAIETKVESPEETKEDAPRKRGRPPKARADE